MGWEIPPELEYHLRALVFATALTTGIAIWSEPFNDRFWSNCAWTFLVSHIGGLALLWWRVPNGRFQRMLDTLLEVARVKRRNGQDE